MHLTDTCIWIDLFNNRATEFVMSSFESNQLGLTSLIYFEVLQGVKNQNTHDKIKYILSQQTFFHLHNKNKSYEQAADIYRQCRKQGVTIRSTVDCLIAQCAIENDLILLHNDKDFSQIATICPALKQQQI